MGRCPLSLMHLAIIILVVLNGKLVHFPFSKFFHNLSNIMVNHPSSDGTLEMSLLKTFCQYFPK